MIAVEHPMWNLTSPDTIMFNLMKQTDEVKNLKQREMHWWETWRRQATVGDVASHYNKYLVFSYQGFKF